MASIFDDLLGTLNSTFKLGLSGNLLKSASGRISVRNPGDSAEVAIRASVLESTAAAGIILNADATETGSDHKITIAAPATGMTGSYTFTYPPNDGSPNQKLITDGTGITSWADDASSSDKISTDTTAIAFGSTSPIAMFNLPENAIVDSVRVIVDTAFAGGTPSLSIGISGTTSKYMPSSKVDLLTAASYVSRPEIPSVSNIESIIATYSANGATSGSGRILVNYSIPS